MSAGLDFNPREVLDHLHELGYTNITADQLKEFIKDLKKLIKYDQRVAEGKIKAGDPRYQNNDEDSDDSDENFDDDGNHLRPPHARHVVSPLTSEMAKSNMRRQPNIDLRLDRNDFTNSQSTSQGSSDVTDSKQYQRILRPKSEPINGDHKPKKSSARPSSAKENILPTRSSSFIRPWKYQSHGPQPGVRSNRCDPVALYHKYQQLWQQNKIPGEDTHSGLRWNIREKMLGQDPHPRPVSQASSVETMTRRRVSRM